MVVTPVPLQSGRVSVFGYAKQVTPGVYLAPTHRVRPDSFDATDMAQKVEDKTLTGALEAVMDARQGVHKVGGKMSAQFFPTQLGPLFKAGIGNDTLSGAAGALGVLTAATAIGAQTVTVTSALPALPSGVADYRGCWISIGTGATLEFAPILSVAGLVIHTWPLKKAHPTSDTATLVANQHILQTNTGVTAATLDLLSLCMQYGQVYERQLFDCMVSDFTIKGDNEKVSADFTFVSNQLLNYEGVVATTIAYGASEAADSPIIQRDGGLLTYLTAADTDFTLHNSLTQFQYDLKYAIQAEKLGGGAQLAEKNVLGERTHALTWQDYADYDGGVNLIHQNFISSDNTMPAFYCQRNAKTGAMYSLFFPLNDVSDHDPVGPTDKPIGYKGTMTPLLDPVTGCAMRMVISSPVVTGW
jgi:hypothetical protein